MIDAHGPCGPRLTSSQLELIFDPSYWMLKLILIPPYWGNGGWVPSGSTERMWYDLALDIQINGSFDPILAEIHRISESKVSVGWVENEAGLASAEEVQVEFVDGPLKGETLCTGRWREADVEKDPSDLPGVEVTSGVSLRLAGLLQHLEGAVAPPADASAEFRRGWYALNAHKQNPSPSDHQLLRQFFDQLGDDTEQRIATHILRDPCAQGITTARVLRTIRDRLRRSGVEEPRATLSEVAEALSDEVGLAHLSRRRELAREGLGHLLSRFLARDIVERWLDKAGMDDADPELLLDQLIEGKEGSLGDFLGTLKDRYEPADTEQPYLAKSCFRAVFATPTDDVEERYRAGATREELVEALGLEDQTAITEYLELSYRIDSAGPVYRPCVIDDLSNPKFTPAERLSNCIEPGRTIGAPRCAGLREVLHPPRTVVEVLERMEALGLKAVR